MMTQRRISTIFSRSLREEKMVDRYTKAVLTVIAVSLAVIAFREVVPVRKADAQNGPTQVIIDRAESFAFQFAGPLQVRER
jgi:hypothetical protein